MNHRGRSRISVVGGGSKSIEIKAKCPEAWLTKFGVDFVKKK